MISYIATFQMGPLAFQPNSGDIFSTIFLIKRDSAGEKCVQWLCSVTWPLYHEYVGWLEIIIHLTPSIICDFHFPTDFRPNIHFPHTFRFNLCWMSESVVRDCSLRKRMISWNRAKRYWASDGSPPAPAHILVSGGGGEREIERDGETESQR